MERIVVFHCNAFNIYYTDSDIYTSTVKMKSLLRFHNKHCYPNAPQFYILH